MIVWSLHDSLARSIGDPLIKNDGNNYIQLDAINVVPLPDGVRYTHAIRCHYLNKAMKAIQREALNNVVALSRYRASVILQRLFPSMTVKYVINIDGLGVQPADQLFIYHVLLASKNIFPAREEIRPNQFVAGVLDDRTVRNIPILDEVTALYVGAKGGSIRPDLVAYTSSYQGMEWLGLIGKEIEDLINESTVNPVDLEISYLPEAPDISKLLPNDNLNFESTWESLLLSKAIMYAQMDSGELGASYQAIPFLETGLRSMNNGNA